MCGGARYPDALETPKLQAFLKNDPAPALTFFLLTPPFPLLPNSQASRIALLPSTAFGGSTPDSRSNTLTITGPRLRSFGGFDWVLRSLSLLFADLGRGRSEEGSGGVGRCAGAGPARMEGGRNVGIFVVIGGSSVVSNLVSGESGISKSLLCFLDDLACSLSFASSSFRLIFLASCCLGGLSDYVLVRGVGGDRKIPFCDFCGFGYSNACLGEAGGGGDGFGGFV